MSLRGLMIPILALATTVGAAAQDARRQLEAHAHGEGKLSIAIDKNTVEMEFETPASDIVGFEHAPSNAAQRKAVADAKSRLAKALDLVQPATAAGCTLSSARVEAIGALAGKSAKGHSHSHKGHTHGKSDGKATAEHSEFKAVYRLDCKQPEQLTAVAFPYFKLFPNAEKLLVTVIGPKGQTAGTATRAVPTVSLAGAI